jgi:acetyl esterase/lipase
VGDEFIPDEIKAFAEQAAVAPIRVPGYWYHQKDKPLLGGAKAAPGEEVIFFVHGGGFIRQSAHPIDTTSTSPTDTLKTLPRIQRLLSIEYRLCAGEPVAPAAHPFPTALLDVLTGYSYLVNALQFEPKNILLCGDSCGANLLVALMRCIRGLNNPAFGMPKAALLYSPWIDIGESHISKDSSFTNFADIDYIVPFSRGMWAAEVYTAPFVKGFYSTNPYISPASKDLPAHIQQGLFKGFPKMFITGGDHEQLIDCIRTFKSRVENDIGKDAVTYMESKDAVHDIVLYPWFEPERAQVLSKVAEWYSTLD